jgi:ribosomal subunit interface protein
MSTQSVQSPEPSADAQSADAGSNAHVQVTGRNVEIPDHFRIYVGQKLSRAERIDHSIHRFDVELSHENNRRQRKNCQRVEITAHVDRGPVVRGEGRAETFYGAFEAAVHKLESRLRRGKDRQKVHYGDKTPVSLHNATAVPLDLAEAFKPDDTPAPQSHDALYEMELVGHDFFLFHDKEADRPSVVYRRHAFDYGLIRLA